MSAVPALTLELDRIDSDGPYAPANCQFITRTENMRKARNTKCTEQTARAVKVALASGMSVLCAARSAGVPYMAAWHISKGNSWRDV